MLLGFTTGTDKERRSRSAGRSEILTGRTRKNQKTTKRANTIKITLLTNAWRQWAALAAVRAKMAAPGSRKTPRLIIGQVLHQCSGKEKDTGVGAPVTVTHAIKRKEKLASRAARWKNSVIVFYALFGSLRRVTMLARCRKSLSPPPASTLRLSELDIMPREGESACGVRRHGSRLRASSWRGTSMSHHLWPTYAICLHERRRTWAPKQVKVPYGAAETLLAICGRTSITP